MSFSVRSGYGYSYEISPSSPAAGIQRRKVELQTYFLIQQRKDDDAYEYEILGVESMSVNLPKPLEDPNSPFAHITYRLKEYSMPSGQIQSLIHDMIDFAKKIVAVGSSVPVISFVVNIKVLTVQLDGETIIDARDRSIRPDCLAPLDLVRTIEKKDKSCRRRRLHKFLLFGLPRVRGDGLHVDGIGPIMETCPICLDGPTAVAPVSLLPCGHAFHSHCVVRWLMNSESCPMCRQDKIILLKEGGVKASQVNMHLPRCPRRVRRPTRRPTRVRRVPSWHHDYVVGSTNHLPGPTRVRRTPTILLARAPTFSNILSIKEKGTRELTLD